MAFIPGEDLDHYISASNAKNGTTYRDQPWLNVLGIPSGDDTICNDDFAIDHLDALLQMEEDLCLCGSETPCSLNQKCDSCGDMFPRRHVQILPRIRCKYISWECYGAHKSSGCGGKVEKRNDVTWPTDEKFVKWLQWYRSKSQDELRAIWELQQLYCSCVDTDGAMYICQNCNKNLPVVDLTGDGPAKLECLCQHVCSTEKKED